MKKTIILFACFVPVFCHSAQAMFGVIPEGAMIETNAVSRDAVLEIVDAATAGMITNELDRIALPVATQALELAQAALPRAWAVTGTVNKSTVLLQPDALAAMDLRGGTAIVDKVSYDPIRMVVVSSAEAYDDECQQAPVGTVFELTNKWATFFPNYAPYYESENGVYAIAGNLGLDSYWRWAQTSLYSGWEEGSHTWHLGQSYDPDDDYFTIKTGYYPYVVTRLPVTNSVTVVTSDLLYRYATTNWVDSIRGIYSDIATNVTYHVVVSNGNWLIIEQ